MVFWVAEKTGEERNDEEKMFEIFALETEQVEQLIFRFNELLIPVEQLIVRAASGVVAQ